MMAKPANGQGEGTTFVLSLNPDNDIEGKALQMARHLAASGHGLRKGILVAFLAAMWDHYQATGIMLDAGQISAAMLSMAFGGGGFPGGRSSSFEGEIVVVSADTGLTADDIAANFAQTFDFF